MLVVYNPVDDWTICSSPKTGTNTLETLSQTQENCSSKRLHADWFQGRWNLPEYPFDKTTTYFGIVRDPVDYYVSGYRMSVDIQWAPQDQQWVFNSPNNLTEHLETVLSFYPLKEIRPGYGDDYHMFLHHCVYHPMHNYSAITNCLQKQINYVTIDTVKHLFKGIHFPHLHLTKTVYPNLTNKDIDLLSKLYDHWPEKIFSFEKTVNTYKEKHYENGRFES
jgi:hypothetical protein